MSLAATSDAGVVPETRWRASADSAAKRILFVDDKPDTFESLREAMSPSGPSWQVDLLDLRPRLDLWRHRAEQLVQSSAEAVVAGS